MPGITAASAAAARLRRPLTERGETDSFVLTTGTCRPGDAAPDLGALARPGTAIAVYMGVARAAEIEAELRAAGMPAACPVDIVASVSTAREGHASATLGTMSETIRRAGLTHPAILFIRYPKSLAAEEARAVA